MRKIACKLAFGYLLIAMFAMLLIGILFIQQFRNFSINEKQKNMIHQAEQFAGNAAHEILAGNSDTGAFASLLASFVNAEVILTDKEGNAIKLDKSRPGKPDASNSGAIPDKTLLRNVLEGKSKSVKGYGSIQNEKYVIVGVPVYNDSKQITGSVFLSAPVMDINRAIVRAAFLLALSILAALVLSMILSVFISNHITSPVKLMNKSAVEMAEGNYGIRTNIRKKDELGQLAASLDKLAERLGFTVDQLFQEKSKLNDLLSSISEGILAFDKDMQLSNYNDSFIILFNLNRNYDISAKVSELLDGKEVMEHFHYVLENGIKRSFTLEYGHQNLKFNISPVINSSDEITGVVSLIQDISQSERLENMRKEFIANISHELRTPLTLIRGSMETIMDGLVTDSYGIRKNYNRILRETAGMERLVSDLQDLSLLQSGKPVLQLEKVDLTELVCEFAGNMQPIANKKNIKIVSRIINENIPFVLGDYDRLRQLLIIFVDNSLKYSNEETTVGITVSSDEKFVYISIEDQGIGIPENDLQNIWERFYKVDKSRNKANRGSGLGLSIARQIIGLHNGTIRAESSPGSGTKIEFGLPHFCQE